MALSFLVPLAATAAGVAGTTKNGQNFFQNVGNWFKDSFDSFTGKKANDISAQNFNLQKEELDYQHQLQQQIFEREDTGYQRAVADARAAGLSALSVNGPSNAGGVVSSTAPQQESTQAGFENGMNALNMLTSVLGNIQNLKIQNKLANSQIAKEAADTSKVLSEIDDMRLRNPITRDILKAQFDDLDLKNNLNHYNSNYLKDYMDWEHLDKLNANLFNNWYGINSSMNPVERMIAMSQNNGFQLGEYAPAYPFATLGDKNTANELNFYTHNGKYKSYDFSQPKKLYYKQSDIWQNTQNENWGIDVRHILNKDTFLGSMFPSLFKGFSGALIQGLLGF